MVPRVAYCAAVLFASLLSVASSSSVVGLTDDTFEKAVEESDFLFVEFYAPWCGHCKRIAPKFEKVGAALVGTAVVAKVDATVEVKAAESADVYGYPTIIMYRYGIPISYDGEPETEEMVDFVKSAIESGTKVISTAAEARAFKEAVPDGGTAVLALFDDPHDKRFRAYEAASILSPDHQISWGHVEKANYRGVSKEFGIPKKTSGAILSFGPKAENLPVKFGSNTDYGAISYVGDMTNHDDILFWSCQAAVPFVAKVETVDMYERIFEHCFFDVVVVLYTASEDVEDDIGGQKLLDVLTEEALKLHKEGLPQLDQRREPLIPTVRVVHFHDNSPDVENLDSFDIDRDQAQITIIEQHMYDEDDVGEEDPDEEMDYGESVHHYDGALDGSSEDFKYIRRWFELFQEGSLTPGESYEEDEYAEEEGGGVPAPAP